MGLPETFNTDLGLLGLMLMNAGRAQPVRQNVAGGFLESLQGLQQYRQGQEDRDMRRQLQTAQLADVKAQADQRTAQARKTGALLDSLQAWTNPSGPLSAANADTVAQTGSLSPTLGNAQVQGAALQQRQQQNPLFGIPVQAIQADLAFNDGKGLAAMIEKRGSPNIEFVNGVAVDKNRTAAGTSIPTISQDGKASQLIADPSAPNGYRVAAPPGALDTFSAYRNADEAAKAGSELVKVFDPASGREVYRTRAQVLQSSGQPGPQAQPSPGRTPEARAPLNPWMPLPPLVREQAVADLADPRTQFSSPAVRAQVMQRAGGAPTAAAAPQSPASMPMAAGPSQVETRSAKTMDLGNEAFMKETFTPTLAAGQAAGGMLVNVTTARNALRNLGATGWGTPTMAAAADVLGSLGVPQAGRYAANAQTFQSAAMERLWATLGEQKGPQTEGDADRAAKTFAQLKNQPGANLYILDLAQAKAERDQMRAKFFREALPLGQKAGDLQTIDREWQSREPSIFSMPSMRKWGQQ